VLPLAEAPPAGALIRSTTEKAARGLAVVRADL